MTRTSRLIVATAVCSGLASAIALSQQPRDVDAPRSGTALIAGMVTTDGDQPRPLRHALVTLSGSASAGNLQAATDDSGRFAFPDLAAGRYTLLAEKPAYVKTFFGSRRIGRGPATPIALADGQRFTGITIPLVRGAVIEGTVFDENGIPLSNAQVRAMQSSIVNGERKLVNSQGSTWSVTDDRGVYRLYGLPPGEYTVLAGGGNIRTETRQTTSAALEAAMREVRGLAPATGPVPDAPLVARTGAYFPGVTDAALAEFITLASGQERIGVDFRSPLVRPTRVEGTAVGPTGQPLRSVMIGIANVSSGSMYTSLGGIQARQDGRFSVTSLTPGRYLFFGRGTETGPLGNPATLPLSASAEVTVNEQDFLDLVLQFLPGTSVSGRLTFRGSLPPPDLTSVRLALTAVPSITGTVTAPPAQAPQQDGSFAFTNVAPGKYRLSMTGGGPWTLRSAIVRGRDTLDLPLEVVSGRDVSDVAVLGIDHPASIAGTALDRLGRPAPEFAILVFSTDRTYWSTAPRRTSGIVKPASDGRFSVAGLPPGEYFVAVVADGDPSLVNDLSLLEQLAGSAIRIALAEGERRTQDVTLSGGGG